MNSVPEHDVDKNQLVFFLRYPRIKLLLVAPVQFADLTCTCPGL